MIVLQARVARWIADDPQPGAVRIEFPDADGAVHRIEEKSAVIDRDDRLRPWTRYPVEVQIACRPRENCYVQRDSLVNVVDLSPWGIGDPDQTYTVERDLLSWVAPAAYTDLSVAARQAVALVTFRRWCWTASLRHEALADLEEHLWQYATVRPDTFMAWYGTRPSLIDPDELPSSLRQVADLRGVTHDDLRGAIDHLGKITHGGLFGAIDSEASLKHLRGLGEITARYGVPLAPPGQFVGDLWIDRDWGRPGESLVDRWRNLDWSDLTSAP